MRFKLLYIIFFSSIFITAESTGSDKSSFLQLNIDGEDNHSDGFDNTDKIARVIALNIILCLASCIFLHWVIIFSRKMNERLLTLQGNYRKSKLLSKFQEDLNPL